MRGIMISLAIMFFCLSVQVVYDVDDAVLAETGDHFLMWRTPEPPLTRDNIPNVKPGSEGLNGSIGIMNVMQQFVGVSEVVGFFGFAYQAAKLILSTLFYSTAGFYWFAKDYLFVPEYLALTASLLVNVTHLFVLWQWLSGKDIRGGA